VKKRGIELLLVFLFCISFAFATVDFVAQSPLDLSSTNTLSGVGLNITYNISISNINLSTVSLYYKNNKSLVDVGYYLNGTSYSSWRSLNYISSNSSLFTFRLYDNAIYPATYNFPEREMEVTPHFSSSLSNANSFVKIQLLNMSNYTEYNFFEIMANSSNLAGTSATVHYCNSSYTGGNVNTNPSCISIYTLSASIPVNHTHGLYSTHQVIPFVVNSTTGRISTVQVTSTSYFVFGGANNWNFYYLTNSSRAGAMQTTTNKGTTWTNQGYTVDSHVHQYDGSDALWYYACANDTENNQYCSSVKSDVIALTPLPPTSVNILAPTESYLKGNISINYTESSSPTNNSISFYNISLLNEDYSFNQTLISNNSINLSYTFDSSAISFGHFIIRVVTTDSADLTSLTYSPNFTVDNTFPQLSILSPEGINYTASSILLNFSTQDDSPISIWYDNGTQNITYAASSFVDFLDGNYSLIVYVEDSAGNLNFSGVNFSVDSHSPNIVINSPLSIVYNYNESILLNVSTSDLNLDSCWWNLDNAGTNSSLNCNELVSINVSEQPHDIYYYANDSFGNTNFSFVHFSVNLFSPSITLVSPTNNQNLNESNLLLNFSVSDQQNIAVCKLFGNFTGVWAESQVNDSIQKDEVETFNLVSLADGYYLWNVWCNDSGDYSAFSLNNWTFQVDTVSPVITLYPSPEIVNTSYLSFNVSVEESNLAEISFFVYNSSGLVASLTNNSLVANFTGLEDGVYYYNSSALDMAGNSNSSLTHEVILDTTAPEIQLNEIDDHFYSYGLEPANLSFSFNFSDLNNASNCTLSIEGTYNSTLLNQTSLTTNPITINGSFLRGNYNWSVICQDIALNSGQSEQRSFIIAMPASSNLSNETTPSVEEERPASSGSSIPLFLGEFSGNHFFFGKIPFYKEIHLMFNDKNYSFRIISRVEETLKLKFNDTSFLLPPNQSVTLDLNGDGTVDVSLVLVETKGVYATINVSTLYENISSTSKGSLEEKIPAAEKGFPLGIAIFAGAIVLILILLIVRYWRSKNLYW